jgi:hypothetical protein
MEAVVAHARLGRRAGTMEAVVAHARYVAAGVVDAFALGQAFHLVYTYAVRRAVAARTALTTHSHVRPPVRRCCWSGRCGTRASTGCSSSGAWSSFTTA